MAVSFAGLGPRSLSGRLIVLGSFITLLLFIYTYGPRTSLPLRIPNVFPPSEPEKHCTPAAYADGQWVFRPRSNLSEMSAPDDALAMSGFQGCASNREFWWHLAADKEEQYYRFPNVSSWDWVPSDECEGLRPARAEDIVRDLVEKGGWMLVGDSMTEGHFFSLSCTLFPHVRATPDWSHGTFDRAREQNLYLDPSSPLLPHLKLPSGFSIESTPLVTFRRIDLLYTKDELISFYNEKHAPPQDFSLFSDEAVWSLSPKDYGRNFTLPLPLGGYSTMVVSTGGHWTTTLLRGLRDESQSDAAGYGIQNVLAFYDEVMLRWADEMQALVGGGGWRSRDKQVVVRAYLPGHDDCHDYTMPWTVDHGHRWRWYNWFWIKDMNRIFERILSSADYPNVHFLPIDRPARLRPDAHATGDCLHIAAGPGVMEGWTHYIWHYVTREVKQGRVR